VHLAVLCTGSGDGNTAHCYPAMSYARKERTASGIGGQAWISSSRMILRRSDAVSETVSIFRTLTVHSAGTGSGGSASRVRISACHTAPGARWMQVPSRGGVAMG
jgi:hypothetical protein